MRTDSERKWGGDPRSTAASTPHDLLTLWPPAPSAIDDASAAIRDALMKDSRERIGRQLVEAPARGEIELARAEELIAEQRLHEAEHLLRAVTLMVPHDFRVRLRLGECLAALGQYRPALIELERARSLPARDVRTIAYHGELVRWLQQRSERPAARTTPLARAPDQRSLHSRLSSWLRRHWRRASSALKPGR